MSRAAILKVLLSEADFFVDGKDLQTFVGATFRSRFFFVCRPVIGEYGQCAGAAPSASFQFSVTETLQSSIT